MPSGMMRAMDVVVVATSRMTGEFARVAGTEYKALIEVGGNTFLECVMEAVRGAGKIPPTQTSPRPMASGRGEPLSRGEELPPTLPSPSRGEDHAAGQVVVVGPPAIGERIKSPDTFVHAGPSEVDAAFAGLEALARMGDPAPRALICLVDLPFVTAHALAEFAAKCPPEADICLPLVSGADFARAFPGPAYDFIRLRGRSLTTGNMILVSTQRLLDRRDQLLDFYRANAKWFSESKRQMHLSPAEGYSRFWNHLALFRLLGAGIVWRYLTGRLDIPHLEARVSRLTGLKCVAVPDCPPELAFDVDTAKELEYAQRFAEQHIR